MLAVLSAACFRTPQNPYLAIVNFDPYSSKFTPFLSRYHY